MHTINVPVGLIRGQMYSETGRRVFRRSSQTKGNEVVKQNWLFSPPQIFLTWGRVENDFEGLQSVGKRWCRQRSDLSRGR